MAMGFNDVPIDAKLAHAVEELKTTTKPLSQIAGETGFGGTGETLVARLVDKGLMTETEIRDRAKAIRGGTYVTE